MMKTKNREVDESKPSDKPVKKSQNQINKEIAEEGFAVRSGHNPNKPNPYEKKGLKKSSNNLKNNSFQKNRELEKNYDDVDNDGNLTFENDELDNPSNIN